MSKSIFEIREGKTESKAAVELDELTAAEKKLINQMYDKKGNLTPMGKKVMDHGKANSKLTPKNRDADNARRKEYNAYQKSKRNEEVEINEGIEQTMIRMLHTKFQELSKIADPKSATAKKISSKLGARSEFAQIKRHMDKIEDILRELDSMASITESTLDKRS